MENKLETRRLIMRRWTLSDGDSFHKLNSDHAVMEFSRYGNESEKFSIKGFW